MKFNRPDGEKRYMHGLLNADSKGFAAGQDPHFTEKDNPYTRFEHSRCWLDGFRRARAASKTSGGDDAAQ